MYNNDVLKLCFEDTKYQALMKLFEVNNALVFSPEISLNKALKLSKQLNDKILLLGKYCLMYKYLSVSCFAISI